MTALNPLPSLIRASAQDAANAQMRRECRAVWNEADWNLMCETQERLIRSCYGRPGDHNRDPNYVYIRFGLAEQMERRGEFHLKSDCAAILDQIDAAMFGDALDASLPA